MRNFLCSAGLTALLVGCIAGPAFADGPPPYGEHMAMHREILEKLGLSDAQKTQLKALHAQKKGQGKAMDAEVHALEAQLSVALGSDMSEADLRALHDKLVQKREQFTAFRFEGMLEVRKILTPDQRKKFAELHQQQNAHQPGPARDKE